MPFDLVGVPTALMKNRVRRQAEFRQAADRGGSKSGEGASPLRWSCRSTVRVDRVVISDDALEEGRRRMQTAQTLLQQAISLRFIFSKRWSPWWEWSIDAPLSVGQNAGVA